MGRAADNIEQFEEGVRVKYNADLAISTGRSRFETAWKNKSIRWSSLLKKLSKSVTTPETHAEYMRMPKTEQDKVKDIGGFVGGHLKEGKRKSGTVACRQIITLDLDSPPADLWTELQDSLEPDLMHALAIYSTHKHTAENPRLRLLMPLDREVNPDEYEAIARKIAEKVGMKYFDPSTFQPSRLMYWPSNSSDVEPVFKFQDLPILKADAVLAEYPDWSDVSYWPEPDGMPAARKKQADKQGDPLTKKGLVGAFCRTYSVTEAIAEFLPDVYEPTAKEGRYTFKAGSSASGLVVYDGDLFAFSNHATDPAGGQLCNAFDLVRIHKFGHLDEDTPPEKSGTSLPSYKAMVEFVQNDPGTKRTLAAERMADAADDFAAKTDPEKWMEKLEIDKRGVPVSSARNCMLILDNDPNLQGIAYNYMMRCYEVKQEHPLPWPTQDKYWRDVDFSLLYGYLCETYRVSFTDRAMMSSFYSAAANRRFHPLKDYIRSLPAWDGIQRVDSLLIRILGAPNTEYVRTVTRKTLVGCICRALEPGCKLDTVLVLDGKPGIGKSTLLRKLGKEWFSDSLSLTDTRDKTAAEKLQGVWIMEIGEMQGTRKADVDILKGFLSRQVDEYRPAFGREVEHRPRMTAIFGTTNTVTGFLRDTTGNRRFWPVPVRGGEGPWNMTDEEVDQIWAEALMMQAEGETVYLDAEMEKEAERMQREAMEEDDRESLVEKYLETLLPEDWYGRDLDQRVDYFREDGLKADEPGTMKRMTVSGMEIFCECFGKSKSTWKKQDGYEIAQIMARMQDWERTGRKGASDKVYGRQRIYERVEAGTSGGTTTPDTPENWDTLL